MGRGCCGKVSQIASGHTNDDIRRCGGPIGSKRRQKRRSRRTFYGSRRIMIQAGSLFAAAFFA